MSHNDTVFERSAYAHTYKCISQCCQKRNSGCKKQKPNIYIRKCVILVPFYGVMLNLIGFLCWQCSSTLCRKCECQFQ